MFRSMLFGFAMLVLFVLVACGTPATVAVAPTQPPPPIQSPLPTLTGAPTQIQSTTTSAPVATNIPPTATPTRVLPTATTAGPASVVIQAAPSIQFLPQTITIKVGTTVIWKNAATSGSIRHEIVTTDWDSPNPGPNAIVGGKQWQIGPGEQVQFTFNAPGNVPYFCGYHGTAMSATIVVVP